MGSRPARPEQDIDRYLQALWVRSAVIHAARALSAAAGAFATVLLVLALSTGPVVSVALSRSLLGLAALCAIRRGGLGGRTLAAGRPRASPPLAERAQPDPGLACALGVAAGT